MPTIWKCSFWIALKLLCFGQQSFTVWNKDTRTRNRCGSSRKLSERVMRNCVWHSKFFRAGRERACKWSEQNTKPQKRCEVFKVRKSKMSAFVWHLKSVYADQANVPTGGCSKNPWSLKVRLENLGSSCCGVKTVLLLSTRNLLVVRCEGGVARLEQKAQQEFKRSGFTWDILARLLVRGIPNLLRFAHEFFRGFARLDPKYENSTRCKKHGSYGTTTVQHSKSL